MSDLMQRLLSHLRCESGCMGRCQECPADLGAEAADELERLTRELEEARKDAERLDWLNARHGRLFILIQSILFSSKESWRAAIDNAMSQEK